MSSEVKKHLFEPFFTTKRVGEGTGMGLASVYGTIRNHRGAITIESDVGRGTTVRLLLPLAAAEIKKEGTRSSLTAVKGAARILLVDDEDVIRTMGTSMLKSLGYEVVTCADGLEAVEYYRLNWRRIDLVILDMVMPRMDGRDAFHAMHQINPSIKALLSSGYSLNDDAQTSLADGVLGFVGKPYGRAEMAGAVAKALAQHTIAG